MGTRSLIHFKDEGYHLVTIYQQFDGYPSYVGKNLVDFLNNIEVINGIGPGQGVARKFANGMGCLAAQFIAEFKTDVGGFYIYPEDAEKQCYDYTVDCIDNKIKLTIEDYEDKIFEGTIEEAIKFIEEYED